MLKGQESEILRLRWRLFSKSLIEIDGLIFIILALLGSLWFKNYLLFFIHLFLFFIIIFLLDFLFFKIVNAKEFNLKRINYSFLVIASFKTLCWTLLVFFMGGIETAVINILYFLIMSQGIFVYKRRVVIVLYGASILFYGVVIYLASQGYIEPIFISSYEEFILKYPPLHDFLSIVLSNTFYLIVFLAMLERLKKIENFMMAIEEERLVLLDILLHKLRNTLTGLRLMMEAEIENREIINDMIDRMISLINKFEISSTLDMVELGRCRNIEFVIDEILSRFPDVAYTVEDDGIEYPMSCDVLKLIVENLVENSYYHGGEGVRVEMFFKKDRIVVRDDGKGIPEHILPRIFDKFFTESKAKGTGLGLYLVKRLVEISKGKITVKSKEGEGTEFVIVFPSKGKPF